MKENTEQRSKVQQSREWERKRAEAQDKKEAEARAGGSGSRGLSSPSPNEPRDYGLEARIEAKRQAAGGPDYAEQPVRDMMDVESGNVESKDAESGETNEDEFTKFGMEAIADGTKIADLEDENEILKEQLENFKKGNNVFSEEGIKQMNSEVQQLNIDLNIVMDWVQNGIITGEWAEEFKRRSLQGILNRLPPEK